VIAGAGVATVTIGTLVGINSFSAQGFTPIRPYAAILGNSTSHTSMTDTAIEALDQEFFGISELTETMKDARNQIHDANAETDDIQLAPYHFDSESFTKAHARLFRLAGMVDLSMEADEPEHAREYLGGALHTLQDFYSHTNWIDLGNDEPNAGLNSADGDIGPIAGPTDQTCASDDAGELVGRAAPGAANPILTSGYYKVSVPNKCRHGGVMDAGSRLHGINKDARAPLTSPDGNLLHDKAAAVAERATRDWIRAAIKPNLTDSELRSLFGVGPSIGFAIDTTGSMGGVISAVKSQATSIVDARLDTPEEPHQYVLSPFNDPGVGPLTVTHHADDFKVALNALYASGGGDCPERSMAGQLSAVSEMDQGGTLFAYTDADANDAYLAPTVAAVAKEKDITVYQMMFGSCYGGFSTFDTPAKGARKGQDPTSPKNAARDDTRSDASAAAVGEETPYEMIARETGGQVFDLTYADAGVITKLADAVVRSDVVDVLSQTADLSGTVTEVPVPVDPLLKTVTFSVGASGSLALEVVRPDGSVVMDGDPEVTVLAPTSGTAQVVSVNRPAAGDWKLRMTGSGRAGVSVTGASTFSLESAQFVAASDVSGDPEAEYQGPITGTPAAGDEIGLDALLGKGYASAVFELRRPDGSVIEKLSLSEYESEFYGPITVPTEPFRVFVTGKEASGEDFVRVRSDLITPSTVTVTAPDVVEIPAGQVTTLEFKVHNSGAAGTFTPSGVDDLGYVTSVTPSPLELEEGAEGTLSVTLEPSADLSEDMLDSLTVTVSREDDPSASNYAVLPLTIITKDTTAPTTTPMPDPAISDSGWARADTVLTLKATDAGSGVKSLSYSVSGAQRMKLTTAPEDTATVRITKEGVSTVTFQATDNEGNVEAPQTYEVKLDKTAPSVRCSVNPKRLKVKDTGLVPVATTVRNRDRLSGPNGFVLRSATDNQGSSAADIVGWDPGRADTQGHLRATQSRGSDRVYTLTYEAMDVAGNVSTCSATVTVDHRIV